MKKNFWMLGMALAALTSCTQSEVVEVPDARAIKFGTFVEKGSRAEAQAEAIPVENLKDMTANSINRFWVLGDRFNLDSVYVAPVFTNEEVQLTGGNWTYENLRYWQSDMIYRFAAYSNANEDNKMTSVQYYSKNAEGDYLEVADYTSDGNKDLVGAIVNDRRTDGAFNTEIKFPFRHLLAKIVVNIKSEVALVSSHFKIDAVSLLKLYTNGDCKYTFTNSTEGTNPVAWTGHETIADYSNWSTVDANKNAFLLSPTTQTFVFYVIPQEFKKSTDANGVTEYQHAPKLAFRARSYSLQYGKDAVLAATDTDANIKPIHTYNEVFNLDPNVPGGSSFARWAPGYVYIYNVIYRAGTAEEKPITFGTPTVTTWGNVISAGLPLTPENSGVADQNNGN